MQPLEQTLSADMEPLNCCVTRCKKVQGGEGGGYTRILMCAQIERLLIKLTIAQKSKSTRDRNKQLMYNVQKDPRQLIPTQQFHCQFSSIKHRLDTAQSSRITEDDGSDAGGLINGSVYVGWGHRSPGCNLLQQVGWLVITLQSAQAAIKVTVMDLALL